VIKNISVYLLVCVNMETEIFPLHFKTEKGFHCSFISVFWHVYTIEAGDAHQSEKHCKLIHKLQYEPS